MRMLIALIVLLLCCFKSYPSPNSTDRPLFLVFSNDGTFYKLDPGEQYVDWRSDLGSRLIYFEVSQSQTRFQNDIATYFIPTVQGHFVYIDKNKQILVHREQIQPLLNICFGKSNESKQLFQSSQQQYFLHEKYQYFFIDLHNGKLWNIENFFQQKIVVKENRHALIKISKKFLKQLKPDFDVKWSAISSKIDIISATQFFKDPQRQFFVQQTAKEQYEFRRIDNHQIKVLNVQSKKSFQMGSTSPIMAVFSYKYSDKKFYKYPISHQENPLLAIQDRHEDNTQKLKNKLSKAQIDMFPLASQFKNANKINQKPLQYNQGLGFDFQYCLNTFRAIKQLSVQTNTLGGLPFIKNTAPVHKNCKDRIQTQPFPPTQQISPTSHPHLFYEPQRSKQQPLIWIFIVGSLIASGIFFYRFKVNKLLNQLEKMETVHDKRFQEIQKRLGQFEQMQKMYEVYWDKLIYRKGRRKSSDSFEDQKQQQLQQNSNKQPPKTLRQIETYEHLVFEGRFLNKQALVYAVPMEGIDLIHVQHQLNDLLSCSHKSLVKLYYYTKNTQFLLIFCQKIEPLWSSVQSSEFFLKLHKKQQEKTVKSVQNKFTVKTIENGQLVHKTEEKIKWTFKAKRVTTHQVDSKLNILVKQVIQCLNYLDSRIQIFSLPLEGIILNQRCVISTQKDSDWTGTAGTSTFSNYQIELKINAIPSILQVYKHEDEQTQEYKLKCKQSMNVKLRHDLVVIFYFINTKGEKSKAKQIQSLVAKEQSVNEQQFFVRDFYDFVLNQNYNLNIEVDSQLQPETKQEEKNVIRKFGNNYQYLRHLICHPFLWDSKRKMLFLSDFSNYIETYLDDFKVRKLQSYAKDYQIIDTPWIKHLDSSFVKEVNQFRKYDFNSVRDLIRLIRNKVNHFHEIPRQTRNSIGKTPEAFIDYMLKIFPKILSFAFIYAKRKKWRLHVQMK